MPTRTRAGISYACFSFVVSLCLFPCVLFANSAPTDINASNLTIAENSAIGTIIGEFNATDPDGDTNITFSIIPYPPRLWLDALDPATIEQVGGNLTKWLNKTGGNHDAVVASGSVKYLADGLGNSLPAVNTSSGQLKIIDSNTSFDGWEKLTIGMVYKWTSISSWNDALWKSAANTSRGYAISKMNVTENQGTGFWYGSSTGNSRLIGSTQTAAIFEPKVLTVVGDGSTGVVKLFANGVEIQSASNFPPRLVQAREYDVKIGGGHLFSEILIYEDALDSAERTSVEDYLMGKWFGDRHGVLVDSNGTLKTNSVFDYETDGNYTITVWASDDSNASYDKNFTITVTNVVEDLDGDGTEDYYDDDIDGDGLSNADELLYNSDPWNASSSNRPPSDINASNLTIAENSAIGTVIGEFNATDPDGDTNITYSLLYSSGTVGWKSSRFYGDADSGINHNYKYTCAVNVGGEGLVINGVPFEGSNSHSGNGWALTSGFLNNWIDSLASSNPVYTKTNVGGGSSHLLNGFRFGGTSQKVKLTGLQIGATYVFSTYNQAFGTSGRRSTLSSTANSLTSTIEQDMYGAGDDDGLLVRHTYIANDSEVEFTFTPATGSSWHLYAFSNHKLAPFSIDENGTLTANRSFDYETESNYSITVQATDDLNASSSQTFTVQITNVIEDLDGDGTEDYYDNDIDGDGVSNANEILYSSDPLDAGSTNSPPFSFSSSSLTVAENSSIGTVVGEFNGTPSNSDDNFTFRILPDAPDGFSPLLWLDAADPFTLYSEVNRTSYALSGTVAGWADKSGRDQHFGQSTSSARPSTGTRIFNGLNVLDFNGSQWMKSNGDFATGTDFSIYMFAKIDAVASEWDSLFCIRNNTPHFQIDAGHTSEFRARFLQSSMGTGKTFASSAMHQAGVWGVTFSGSRSKHVGFSFNGEGFGGSHSYDTSPNQMSNTLNIFSNRGQDRFPEGFVGEFIVVNNMDYPGGGGVQEYLQRKWLGETYDHDPFVLDTNGTLLTNRLLDFETDEQNQTLQIIASTGSRQSMPQEFIVSITDVEEDLDGDGVEDFYDSDSDGDGLSNLQEFLGRSDPLNSSSSNAAPSEINATTSLSFSESLALGAIAVDFNATDTNSDANITYRLQPKIDISDVPGISGWFDASDMDSLTTDLSGNTVLSWENQVDSSVAMVAGNKPPSSGSYLNGLHALFFDRNETMVSKKGDDVWSPWTSDGSIAGSFTDGSFFLVFRTYEIQRTALPNLGNWWGGHMPWIGGGIFWDIWKGGEVNRIWGSLTSGHENMVVSFYHSVTDSSRQFFKNGKLLVSGAPVATTVLSPVHFPSTYEEPQFLYGEMIFVRQNITHADRAKIEGYLTHKWSLADQLPSDHPYAGIDFTIDENGSLRTARQFDYETDDHNYSVRIWATDEHNATTYNDFTVTLNNVVEDLDGDGTEDHYDDDIDGDGLSNADELLYNSDPWDASSSNRPPSDINASNLTIAENSAIGTVIGEFNATDPDGEGNFTFSINSDSLLLWLPFDERNGTQAENLGSANTHGALMNGAVFSTDEAKFGPSSIRVPISSVNSRVLLSTPIALGNGGASNPYSVSTWFKGLYAFSETVHGWRTLIRGTTNNHHIILNKESNEIGTYRDAWFGSGKILPAISSESNWQHLVATFDGVKTTFYIDGNLLGSVQKSPGLDIQSIGNYQDGNQHFAEYLDDFRVYSKVLSDREISSLYHFSMDGNGTLSVGSLVDHETDSNFTITVRATDDHNVSFDKNFTITLTNVVEDLDGDGIEDHNDLDIDGDGLSNADELAYNSDPWDASSINRPPNDINASNLTIAENSAIGTVIGEFNATDPDGEGNFTYSFAPPKFEGFSPLLWLDANDPSTITGISQISQWRDKSGNGFHANQSDLNYMPKIIEQDGNSFIRFDGSNDFLNPGTLRTSVGSGEVYIVAQKKSSSSDIWQRLFSSFNGSGNDYSNRPNWHMYPPFNPNGSGKIFEIQTFLRILDDRSLVNTKIARAAFKSDMFFGGDIAEIIIFNDYLAADEVQRVQGYLAHKWGFVNSLAAGHPFKFDRFSLDQNGTLTANQTFDYETDDRNYTITVRVTDDHNISFDKNFTITVANVVEDLDGDGTEDHYDLDIDGDGLSNADELLYNSDPWDASSMNRPPTDINASNLTIAENSAIGTVIGEFNATDPDGEENFTYSINSDSLVIWLPFDETNGSTTQNYGSFSTSVSLVSDANFSSTEKMFGASSVRIPLSSATSRLEFSNPLPLGNTESSNDFSVSVWFKGLYHFNETGSGWRTLTRGSSTNHHIILNNESDEIGTHRSAWYGSGQNLNPIDSQENWQHLVATFNGSTAKFFIDGTFLSSVPKSAGLDIKSVGNHKDSGTQQFAEYLDDFRVYSKVLSGNEISSLYHFSMDQNGTLSANQTFDYETDDRNYTITVWATDDHNASFDKNFTISVTNVVEDLDGDETEDHYDLDIDGDGFSNADEIAYGSNPLDPNSVANSPPNSLVLGKASIYENEPAGTIVGKVSGTDPDGSVSLIFTRAQGQGSRDNNLFYIGPHDNLRSKQSFDYESNQTFTVRLKVTDEHNASLEQIFEVQVLDVDDTAPVITLNGDANITHEAGSEYIDAGGEWIDAVDGTGQAQVSGEVNASKPGTYFLTYAHSDVAGNSAIPVTRKVEVVDTSSPQISLLGDANLTHLVGLNFIDQGAVWTDAVDVQGIVLGSGQVNDRELGTYFLSYTYRDSHGNDSPNIIRTINVVDSESPVIRLLGRSKIIHEAGIVFVDSGAIWFDQVDGNGTAHVTGEVNSNLPGEYSLTYSFTDSSGNSAVSVSRIVSVVDRIAPSLTLNGEAMVSIPVGSDFTDHGAGWTDAVDGAGQALGTGEVNTSVPGDYLLIYVHTDKAGNKSKNLERLVRVFSNAPENLVSADKLTIKENRPIGSVIGHFRANDLNESSLRFELISGGVDDDRLLFSLDLNGTLKTGTIFDYESDDQRFPITVRVWNEHNKSVEKDFYVSVINVLEDMDGDGVEDVIDEDRDGDGISNDLEVENQTDPDDPNSFSHKPILLTRSSSINEDGSIDLLGTVFEDGNGKITDFGFVLSSGISIDPKKSKVLWIRGVGEPEGFKLKLTQSPYQPILYFRAWAKNIAGYGIGPVRKVRIPEAPKPWWGEVQERAGGWKTSGWFGNFISYEKGWLYHARLGWLYSSPASESSVWLWKQNRGWLWTKEEVYPYMWSDQTGNWIYIYPGEIGEPLKIFDYSTQSSL